MAAGTETKTNPNLVQSNKWYEIFEVGNHTDSSGDTKYWSENDLKEIASKSNASKNDVPLVIGHPVRDTSPAWGWSKKNFRVENDKLLAQFKDITPSFADAVNNKQYPKISVSIRGDGTLRHIGFLGGNPPAIPGLEEVQFSSDKDDFIYECEFKEFKEYGDDEMAVTKIETDAREKELQDLKSAVAEFMEQAKIKDRKIRELKTKTVSAEFAEKAKQKEEEVLSLKTQLTKVEKEKRHAEYKEFCEKHKTRITPAMKPFVTDLFEILHEKGEYNFSEGTEKNSVVRFKSFLESLPEQISFGEFATKDRATEKPSDRTSEFSEFENVDKSQLELDCKVKDYMEKHNITSYVIALQKVRNK